MDIQNSLKVPFRHMAADELANQPVSILHGVSDAAVSTLRSFGIETVFELGVSQLFQTALLLTGMVSDRFGPIARFQQVPSELLDADSDVTTLEELAQIPIAKLRNVSRPAAEALENSLGVTNLDELGRWAPFLAARRIIHGDAMESELVVDPEIPQELVPKFNEYPTEKFFYSVYTIDSAQNNAPSKPISGAIDLAELEKKEQFLKVRTGAIVRYEQAWMPVGLALGNLLHSLALAPGESTRIAMIDWSRRQGVRTSEDVSQTESLANSTMHTRSINEVTRAVANEAQGGFSQMNANSTVSNTADSGFGLNNSGEALAAAGAGASVGAVAGAGLGGVGGAGVGAVAGLAGAGFGAIPGAIGGGLIGAGAGGLVGAGAGGAIGFLGAADFGAGSSSQSDTATEVVTTTSSSGSREIAASMSQNIADRTQQHSSSARNRRATIVQEVWQSESEEVTTRAVTNYNHMHALTVQYFEVVQMYRLVTGVNHLQRALYIPMKSIRWNKQNVERYRAIVLSHALDLRVVTAMAMPPKTTAFTFAQLNSIDTATATAFLRGQEPHWGLEGAKTITDGPVANTPLEPWVLPRGCVLLDYHVGRYMRSNSQTSVFQEFEPLGARIDDSAIDQPLSAIRQLNWRLPARDDDNATDVTLDVIFKFSYKGSRFYAVYPLVLTLNTYPAVTDAVTLPLAVLDHAPEEQWLIDHLNMFNKHYSRAVWRSVDEADITTLLSDYTFEGKPVVDNIDRKPVAISGQYLVFAYHNENTKSWEEWRRVHGFLAPNTSSVELLPMPTGGVFAEAVLGRANSAEKLDLTRFWNWQDSPIPISAPDIAAVQAGSRAESADVRPGQLDAPLVANQAPSALPDPQGMASVLNAITTANMFRDMSGISEARQLASQALQQAQAGATAAGDQASANLASGMQLHGQVMDKVLSMIGDLSTQIAGAGFGALTGAATSVGAKDISSAGAIVNEAAKRDAEKAQGPTGSPSTPGASTGNADGIPGASSGAASGSIDAPSGQSVPHASSLEDDAIQALIGGGSARPLPSPAGGGVEFASTGGSSAATLIESGPAVVSRMTELMKKAKPGKWYVNGELKREVTRGQVFGSLMVVYPMSGSLVYYDEGVRALYYTSYSTFFRSLVPISAFAEGGARALWLETIALIEFEVMIGAIFGIPEIIAIRALQFVQYLNTHQREAAILQEELPAIMAELQWFHQNFPQASDCLLKDVAFGIFKNLPNAATTLGPEKWAYFLARLLNGGIASEAAKNLLLYVTVAFGLTVAAFTVLTVLPASAVDEFEQEVQKLKNGFASEGLELSEECAHVSLLELLNHPDPNELKQKMQKLERSADRLLPVLKNLVSEAGITI